MFLLTLFTTIVLGQQLACHGSSGSIYDFNATLITGENVSLSTYRGFVTNAELFRLKCLTVRDYTQMNSLMNNFSQKPFIILGFPCGQFENQEPGTGMEIMQCLKSVRPGKGFVPLFPIFAKGHVNGQDEQPLFTYLKSSCDNELQIMNNPAYIDWSPVRSYDITWNFAKFLVDKKGIPFKRYHYLTPPVELTNDINSLLS